MKNEIKFDLISIDTLKVSIFVGVNCEYKKYLDMFETKIKSLNDINGKYRAIPEYFYDINDEGKSMYGRCLFWQNEDNKTYWGIWIGKIDNLENRCGVIAHEVSHLMDILVSNFSFENETEFKARVTGYIVEKITSINN